MKKGNYWMAVTEDGKVYSIYNNEYVQLTFSSIDNVREVVEAFVLYLNKEVIP